MRYSEIKDIRDLDKAREALAVKISRKEVEVTQNLEKFKKAYSPAGLTVSALKSVSGLVPFDKLALLLVRKTIDALK